MDPMAEKHFNETPYAYVSNNQIIFIDPDGSEKIISLDNNNVKDQKVISAAENYKDDNAIHIFAHGWTGGIQVVVNGEKQNITSAKGLDQFLSKNSETWQNRQEGDETTIVLHSCNSGKDGKDGKPSFAQKVSESDAFKDSKVVAPDERVFFTEDGEMGTYQSKTDKEGEVVRNEKGTAIISDKPGSWRIFKGGEQTGSYNGDWKPKEKPTLMDRLTKKEN